MQVGVDKPGGVAGINHDTTVFPVVEDPTARMVGVLHIIVCVGILADTCGERVFCNTGTEIAVLQKFELS